MCPCRLLSRRISEEGASVHVTGRPLRPRDIHPCLLAVSSRVGDLSQGTGTGDRQVRIAMATIPTKITTHQQRSWPGLQRDARAVCPGPHFVLLETEILGRHEEPTQTLGASCSRAELLTWPAAARGSAGYSPDYTQGRPCILGLQVGFGDRVVLYRTMVTAFIPTCKVLPMPLTLPQSGGFILGCCPWGNSINFHLLPCQWRQALHAGALAAELSWFL